MATEIKQGTSNSDWIDAAIAGEEEWLGMTEARMVARLLDEAASVVMPPVLKSVRTPGLTRRLVGLAVVASVEDRIDNIPWLTEEGHDAGTLVAARALRHVSEMLSMAADLLEQ